MRPWEVHLGLLVLLFALSISVCAEQRLTAAEAIAHVGEQASVCGSAVGVHYAASMKGEPTFINLDKPYPTQIFTILIWGSDRPKFGTRSKNTPVSKCAQGER